MSGVSGVSGSGYNNGVQSTTQTNQANQTSQAKQDENQSQQVEVAADEYKGSVEKVDSKTYNKDMFIKIDREKINEMKADLKNNIGAFQTMVQDMYKNNGVEGFGFDVNDDQSWKKWVSDVVSGQIKVSQEDSDAAREAIGEEGYWGVEKTSQRIVDFAKSISGGDIEQYDKLMGAIEKGFGAAKEAWGRDMPDITSQTYDAVKQKMEAWKQESSTVQQTGALESV